MDFQKKVTVTGKRQITLPVELCRELGIKAGQQLEVTARKGDIRLQPVLEEKPLSKCSGFLESIGTGGELSDKDKKDHDQIIADEADPRRQS